MLVAEGDGGVALSEAVKQIVALVQACGGDDGGDDDNVIVALRTKAVDALKTMQEQAAAELSSAVAT